MKRIIIFTILLLVYTNIFSDDKVRNETRVSKVWSDLNIKGNGVIVAILDTGVNYNHTDLNDHVWNHPARHLL